MNVLSCTSKQTSQMYCRLQVWTGLRFLAGRWFWSNAAPVSDGDLPPCPNEIRRCGALAKTGTGSVETIDCAERLNFLCYSTP